MKLQKVKDINDVYNILNHIDINPYVGTHINDIIVENLPAIEEIPKIYIEILSIIGLNGFLAGGAVRALVTKANNASDFDVYSYTKEGRIKLIHSFLNAGYTPYTYNKNCLSLTKNDIQVQIIFSFVGTIPQVIDEFDFTICRIATDGRCIYKDKDFDHNVEHKLIRIKTVQCPIAAVRRIIKYIKKGFFITNFQIFKIYQDFMKRPQDYKEKLESLLQTQEQDKLNTDELQDLYEILKKVD